jgi:hypothetical protein
LPLPGEPSLNLDKNHQLYKKNVERLLNDFDFIALGAFKGVYDEHMLYSALANDFVDPTEWQNAILGTFKSQTITTQYGKISLG